MSAKTTDLSGCHFGNLHVLGPAPNRRWLCACSCGNHIEASRTTLQRGKDSCGCLQKRHTRWAGRVYRSKYEVFTAMALDLLHIPNDYEPELFSVKVRGKHRGYLPDFHLIDDDSWLEVKGSQRGVAKFNDFAKSHRARLMKKEQVEKLCGCKLAALYTQWRKHGPEAVRQTISDKLGEQSLKRTALASLGR